MNKFLPIIMSGILALPVSVFAASSVRTLGGTGTYNGVTSVGSGTATRAGSIRAVPSVKVSKTTTSATTTPSTSGSTGTVSGNTGAGTRMSIGKYLSGSGVISTKVSSSAGTTELADDISNLTINIDELAKRLQTLEAADYITVADLSDDNLSEDYLTKNEIEALLYINETELNNALAQYKTDTLDPTYATKQDLESIDVAGAIAGALDGYAKTSDLNDYAKTSDLNTGFEQVNVELTNVDNKITELNTKIENVEIGISSFSVYPGAFNPNNLDTGKTE